MDRERGAVLVEMAIVVPILILLVFGMLEFGLAFKDKLTMAHAVNQATRNATVLGTDQRADFEILSAFEAGMVGAVSIDTVTHVDIFKADANGNPIAWDRYIPDGPPAGGLRALTPTTSSASASLPITHHVRGTPGSMAVWTPSGFALRLSTRG